MPLIESRKSLAVKITLCFALGLLIFARAEKVCAQVPSQNDQLRIQLWTDVDDFPGQFPGFEEIEYNPTGNVSDFDQSFFSSAIARLKEIAPFLLSGMLEGWTYDYVPYDKTRRVDEFFESELIRELDPEQNPISWHNPVVEEGNLVVWAYCNRTPAQKVLYQRWDSITNPRVHGKGTGPVNLGNEGIKTACYNAIKNAVREYWRIYEKNKPKEIMGKVLLVGTPRIYISEGQYVVDLDFFMETDKIIRYTNY